MNALFLILALQVPVQTDTVTQTTILPRPEITINGDSIWIAFDVDVDITDSLAADAERGAMAACDCASGTPGWFYAGALLVSAAAVIVWARKESTTITVTNEQGQEQATTTTTRRGWWKKPKGGHPHGG